MKFKKGVAQYIAIIVSLGIATVTLMITVIVIAAFRDSQTAGSLPYNITNSGLNLFSGITSQFTTIGTISGVLLLAGVVAAFGFGGYALYKKM